MRKSTLPGVPIAKPQTAANKKEGTSTKIGNTGTNSLAHSTPEASTSVRTELVERDARTTQVKDAALVTYAAQQLDLAAKEADDSSPATSSTTALQTPIDMEQLEQLVTTFPNGTRLYRADAREIDPSLEDSDGNHIGKRGFFTRSGIETSQERSLPMLKILRNKYHNLVPTSASKEGAIKFGLSYFSNGKVVEKSGHFEIAINIYEIDVSGLRGISLYDKPFDSILYQNSHPKTKAFSALSNQAEINEIFVLDSIPLEHIKSYRKYYGHTGGIWYDDDRMPARVTPYTED